MHPDAPKLLWDAQRAIANARRFVRGKHYADYAADDLLRSAVERQLEVAGEALSKLRRVDPETAAQILDLSRLVGLRNVLIHGYASVDDRIVWGIVEAHLSSMEDAIRRMLPV
jgi:uncharacterized protein with HEPN domain